MGALNHVDEVTIVRILIDNQESASAAFWTREGARAMLQHLESLPNEAGLEFELTTVDFDAHSLLRVAHNFNPPFNTGGTDDHGSS